MCDSDGNSFVGFSRWPARPGAGSDLSLLEVSLGAQRGDKEPISSDVTGGVAPCQSEGTVAQLANLQVSGAHHPHLD